MVNDSPMDNDCSLQIYDQLDFKKKALEKFVQPISKLEITVDGFV